MDWMTPWLVHLSGVPTLSDDGEGNTVYVVIQRDTHRLRGVRDPFFVFMPEKIGS